MSKGKKIVLSIFIIVAIIVSVAYFTYAYFLASTSRTGISGGSYNASFSVSSTVVYKATKLIPVTEANMDATVNKASNNCLDNNSREVCSLYKVDVTNGSVAITLNGFVKTNSSTYTTSNLKYKVYTKSGNTYTAVTDAASVSNSSGASVYFQKNGSNLATSVAASGTQTYYVAFWINETNGAQNADQDKDYSCRIGFDGTDGSSLSVAFNV